MNELSTLTLSASEMKFSAAHFTLFSATERENIHGHNFTVTAKISSELQASGLLFDYKIFKQTISEMCAVLDEKLLLPTDSPYLKVENSSTEVLAYFDKEILRFLPRDVLFLPIANISVENLAHYFLHLLLDKKKLLEENKVKHLTLIVASSPSQSGEASWSGHA